MFPFSNSFTFDYFWFKAYGIEHICIINADAEKTFFWRKRFFKCILLRKALPTLFTTLEDEMKITYAHPRIIWSEKTDLRIVDLLKYFHSTCLWKITNQFHAIVSCRYALLISENLFFYVFRGYRRTPAAWNSLIHRNKRFSFPYRLLQNLEKPNQLTENKTTKKAVFIVNFEHISHLFLVFLMLTLNK